MEVVSFDLAVKLKEKGYPQNIDKYTDFYPDGVEELAAPTISQVLKWLRKKDIMVEIPIDLGDNGVWQFTFRIQTKEFYERATKCDYASYESAALSCIEYVLNNLI